MKLLYSLTVVSQYFPGAYSIYFTSSPFLRCLASFRDASSSSSSTDSFLVLLNTVVRVLVHVQGLLLFR